MKESSSLIRDGDDEESVESSGKDAITSVIAVSMSLICLLYTSPSPRDKRQSRMPSSA